MNSQVTLKGRTWRHPQNCAFKIYRVKDGDGANAVFAATQNFTYGQDLDTTKDPYKDKGFVVVRKGGDGAAYKKPQAKNTQLLGILPGRADLNDQPIESGTDVLTQQ